MRVRRNLAWKWVLLFLGVAILLLFGYKLLEKEWGSTQRTIIFIPKTIDPSIEFWQVMKQGVASAAKEFGATVEVMGTSQETEVDEQIAIIREAIAKKPKAILLAATDFNHIVPVAEEIKRAGIRLITVDSGLANGISTSFIGTDNVDAGRKTADLMRSHVEPNAEVAIINFVKNSATAMQREQGVLEVLHQVGNYKVHGPYYSNGSAEKARSIVTALLQDHPNVTGIIGLNEPSTIGAAQAIEALQRQQQVTVIGFDSSYSEIKLIDRGVMAATVIQRPFNMGYMAVKTAMELLDGKSVPKTIDTGSKVITKDNMYTRENQKLLFPFVE